MNQRINELCEELSTQGTRVHELIGSLHVSLINLKISAAKLGGVEGRSLGVVADYLDSNLKNLDTARGTINKICTEIIQENMEK